MPLYNGGGVGGVGPQKFDTEMTEVKNLINGIATDVEVVDGKVDELQLDVDNLKTSVEKVEAGMASNKHPGTVTVVNSSMNASQSNVQVCNVTGKGILYTAFLSSLRAGSFTVKITLDGTTYTISGKATYECSPGYVARESIIGSGAEGYDTWLMIEGCVTDWDGQFESCTPTHGNVFLKMTDATSYTHDDGVPLVFTETGIPFNNSLVVTMSNGGNAQAFANVLYTLTN